MTTKSVTPEHFDTIRESLSHSDRLRVIDY